jgi:thiaminase/transcriptional activator TenA
MSFYAHMRVEADSIWSAIHRHPFLAELGNGSLSDERFLFYMTQDYPYLKEFCRVLALAVARGGDVREMTFFTGLLTATLTTEMELHRRLCRELGIAEETLESAALAPTAHAYTRHLLSVGALGTRAEMTAALLPCVVSYAEIGRSLSARPPESPVYRRWIEAYASDEYQSIAQAMVRIADDIEPSLSRAERDACRELFLVGSRYEWRFWEMAYTMERWGPVTEAPGGRAASAVL